MTTEEEKLVTDNIGLAYDVAWKYNKKFGGLIALEELQSLAFLGLTKAANTYNKELGYNFSTYAYTTIKNEILGYYRNNKKHIPVKSLSEKISEDLELGDTISSEIEVIEELTKQAYIDKLYIEIDTLNDRYRSIIQYKLQGLTMNDIGKQLNISQAQVSIDYNKALNILRAKFKDWR